MGFCHDLKSYRKVDVGKKEKTQRSRSWRQPASECSDRRTMNTQLIDSSDMGLLDHNRDSFGCKSGRKKSVHLTCIYKPTKVSEFACPLLSKLKEIREPDGYLCGIAIN